MAKETSTITLKRSTKERLESLKGESDWNTFLEELYLQKRKKKGMNSLAKLRELLDDKDLDRIEASSKKFRKEFKLH
ncbi:MAG: antitoxin VapB family protein [Nitrososphaerales archaeon]